MPELPDVETFRRYFAATSLHQPVESIHVEREELLEGTTPSGLGRKLHGQSFTGASRHGKYLLAELDGGDFLVFHFGMTGFLRYYRNRQQEPGHSRVEYDFENGFTLAFDCQADPERMPDGYLLPHRESGASCPRCSGEVEKVDVSGRSAYCCPSCQKPA